MVITVGPPAGLLIASTPSKAAIRRSTPRRPVPRPGSAPPSPSSRTVIRSAPSEWRRSMSADCAAGVLGHVGEQLADREVGGRLDRRGRPAVKRAGHPGAGRAVEGERPDRVGQAPVGQHRRVHAAHQVAQLGQGLGGRVAGLDELIGNDFIVDRRSTAGADGARIAATRSGRGWTARRSTRCRPQSPASRTASGQLSAECRFSRSMLQSRARHGKSHRVSYMPSPALRLSAAAREIWEQ